MAALCSLVIAPFAAFSSVTFVLVPAIAYGAIMGARCTAALPASNQSHPPPPPPLVPVDHSSRQGHGVVFTD